MELVKKGKDFVVYKKRSGRFAVQKTGRKWVNGEEKVKILVKEGLVKAVAKKKKSDEPAASAE
jgi:hypothetical protein